jgi:hypothetical protein
VTRRLATVSRQCFVYFHSKGNLGVELRGEVIADILWVANEPPGINGALLLAAVVSVFALPTPLAFR